MEGSNFLDQLAAGVGEGRDGGSMTRKGVVNENLLQIISVATPVAISRRVSRFKLQLRDRQEARRSRGRGDDKPTPMAWGMELGCGLRFRIEIRVGNEKEGERTANGSR